MQGPWMNVATSQARNQNKGPYEIDFYKDTCNFINYLNKIQFDKNVALFRIE